MVRMEWVTGLGIMRKEEAGGEEISRTHFGWELLRLIRM